jgi:hypothetical protein
VIFAVLLWQILRLLARDSEVNSAFLAKQNSPHACIMQHTLTSAARSTASKRGDTLRSCRLIGDGRGRIWRSLRHVKFRIALGKILGEKYFWIQAHPPQANLSHNLPG